MKKLIVSSVAAACLLGSVSAQSREVEVRIKHADLDLSKSRDLAKLRERARTAIENACAAGPGQFVPFGVDTCFVDAMTAANEQIRTLRDRAMMTLVAKN